jgi:hypothetical protein
MPFYTLETHRQRVFELQLSLFPSSQSVITQQIRLLLSKRLTSQMDIGILSCDQ